MKTARKAVASIEEGGGAAEQKGKVSKEGGEGLQVLFTSSDATPHLSARVISIPLPDLPRWGGDFLHTMRSLFEYPGVEPLSIR